MVKATFHFPRGFLWGTATSSHQVEGYNTNNQWWALEQEPGRILNGDKSEAACGWWGGRWRDDFDRAAEGGQNAHRFSIEWSRVQPVSDKWDETAIDRYREMARGLQQRGMTALVTLHHFSDPLWIWEECGWENPAIVERFEAYTRKIVEALQEYVNLWVTINEPNVYAICSYLLGGFPPCEDNLQKTGRILANMVRAHSASYRAIKHVQPASRVGVAHNYRGFHPARSWSPFDRAAAGIAHRYFNNSFPRTLVNGVFNWPFGKQRIPEARGTQDFFGLNYYTADQVSLALKPGDLNFLHRFFAPGSELSENGFIANLPEDMFRALEWSRSFGLPILITENGVEDSTDRLRPRYLVQHLHQVWRAVNFNFPIKGYFHWSLVDNFEWERGWSQRFGLWELDVQTQQRRKRPSADLYAEICRANAISREIVERYAPELVEQIFPE
jgi:beta-glucosidase